MEALTRSVSETLTGVLLFTTLGCAIRRSFLSEGNVGTYSGVASSGSPLPLRRAYRLCRLGVYIAGGRYACRLVCKIVSPRTLFGVCVAQICRVVLDPRSVQALVARRAGGPGIRRLLPRRQARPRVVPQGHNPGNDHGHLP